MLYIQRLVFIVASLACLAVVLAQNTDMSWSEFKTRYDKSYNSELDDAKHRAIFEAKKIWINKVNGLRQDFRLELNMYSDWSLRQLKRRLLGFTSESRDKRRNSKEAQAYIDSVLESSIELPDKLDWRSDANRVSPVKDQGRCASDWAFAAIGSLEGQEVNYGINEIVSLSEQALLDCSTRNQACRGGSISAAFKYIVDSMGVESNESYPYVGGETLCKFNKSRVIMKMYDFAYLNADDEQSLRKLVALHGPVPVAMYATPVLFSYKKGIINDSECTSLKSQFEPNHAVLVVGYDSDPKLGDYWIVKNSWGSDWGEEGYFRLRRDQGNKCGIANTAIISLVGPPIEP